MITLRKTPRANQPMRLRTLLALVISLTVSIGVVTYASYVAHHQSALMEEDVRREAVTLADAAAASLPYALLTFNVSEVEERVNRFSKFPGIIGVRVANPQGEIIAELDHHGKINTRITTLGSPAKILPNLNKTESLLTPKTGFLQVRQIVKLKSFTAGWIEIDYSLQRFEEDKQNVWRSSFIIGIVLLVAINALLMAMLERPLRSLESLTRFAAELGNDPGKTVHETTPVREVSDLQTALNSASMRLNQQQQAIMAGSLRLQLLLDNAGDAVLVTDQDGNICLFNPAAERLFGWTTYDALGFTLQRILPELSPDIPAANSQETWGLRQDGRALELELSVSVIQENNGTKRIFVVRDITARKELEREWIHAKELAEKANVAKSDFLANMSHEIRTPMNGILGMTEMLLDTNLSYEQRDYLHLMKSSADALLQIINDILDFSKIESSRLTMEAVEFDLRALARAAMHTLAIRAAEKHIELILDVADDVPEMLIGDPLRLRQILLNLVGNAIKFTYEGEVELVIRLSETASKPLIYFGVRDTGIGIAPENQSAIFEAFTQADTSTTRQFGGTGLGLAISHRLVAMMGGHLVVRSQEGMGSLFFFSISLPGKPGSTTASLTPKQQDALKDQPVLIVDDNFTNRRLLQTVTTQCGMQTKIAPDGATALNVLRSWPEGSPFPLLILDSHLPDMDGFAIAETLRSDPKWRQLKLMMLTPSHRKGDQARASALNVAAYLLKPVEKQEFLAAIARTLTNEIAITVEAESRFTALSGATSLSILAAEDNVVNQRLIVGMLEKLGHKVRLAFDGQDAVQQFEQGSFDLILMDVQMPILGGLDATRKIRQLEIDLRTHMPIVAMTANAMPGDKQKCLDAGMDDYLAKPLRLDELAAVLNRIAGTITPEPAITVGTKEPDTQTHTFQETAEVDMTFTSPLDSTAAIERLGGDPSMYRMLIEMYLDDQANQIKSLFSAFAAHDAKTFERAAHSVKGLMASLGAESAREFSWTLEQAGRAGNWDIVTAELPKLVEMMNTVEHQLREWLSLNP